MEIIHRLAEELGLQAAQVEKAVALLDEGNTVPFIARYRKEATGSLDDIQLRNLSERLSYLRGLEKRKEEVQNAIDGQGKLTPEILHALEGAQTLTEVEDIYRPFKQKRKTRASVARERGLEPLAALLLAQKTDYGKPIEAWAAEYTDSEKGVKTVEDALNGACDILAEDIADNALFRKAIRTLTVQNGRMKAKQCKDEPSVYEMYYQFDEKIQGIPGHRILALNRAEREGFLKVSLELDPEIPLGYLRGKLLRSEKSPARPYLTRALEDSYDRLIAPAVEREIRADLLDAAGEGAIRNFSTNLRQLLMQPPLRGHVTMGLDPGYRTGCKLAVVDATGKVLDTAVIYPTKPQERVEEAGRKVREFIERYGVTVIAIGNGTASKESEIFIAGVLRSLGPDCRCGYAMVSEAGASVYSASPLGAEEFPDFDVTQRSAVSIARRLQDPLAELVKIEPRSIGVGQYQHDMKPARLDEALSGVVENCVNAVGVDVNTASWSLLSYVAGVGESTAKNIVRYREENGPFQNRGAIKKVPRIGAKAFEQCAGFLRVPESEEILDQTGVHPESYGAVRKLLRRFDLSEEDVRQGKLGNLRKMTEQFPGGQTALCEELGVGLPTLLDILTELEKPGRDLRDSLPQPTLRTDVMDMKDLREGMELTGTVRNVIDFGAFVDIGVHQDGLVHISQICDRYVRHPSEVLSVGDTVRVRVLGVDVKKGRISLTMKF